MAKTLEFTIKSPRQIKQGDTETMFTFICKNDGSVVDLTKATNITAKIGNASGYLRSQPITINSLAGLNPGWINLQPTPTLISGLPAGDYQLEIWVIDQAGTSIYPSDKALGFTITNNIQSTNGDTITTITFDDFVNKFYAIATNKEWPPSALYGSIVSGAPAKINSVAKTLTLESVWNIVCGTKSTYLGTTVIISLDPDNTGNTGFWIGFSPESKKFSVYQSSNSIPASAVYLGWISIDKKVDYDLHINAVEVDGLDTASLAFDKKAVVASKNPFSLNLKNKTLTPPDDYVNIFTSKGKYSLRINDPVNLDNGSTASFVYYAISTGSIKITIAAVSQSSDLIFLGWISWDSPTPNYDFIFNYTVDGLVPGVGLGFGFANKVGTTFGDSITQGVKLNGATNWTTMIGEKLHLSKITNAGISGTTYTKSASRANSAVDRANTITGQDLITVWFGINDYHYGRPLGAFGDGDVTTVFGATDYVYKTLITNNPTATVVVITPMKQHGYLTYPDSFTKNSAGLLQIDYVNAIKQVADYYSLPVLDFYQMSGISPFVDAQNTQYFFDGLHPNAAGQYRVAQKISRFIEING
ncbi:SGNH/GDSL hydrolase family protein [Lactiplantibacillus paraplantarum]